MRKITELFTIDWPFVSCKSKITSNDANLLFLFHCIKSNPSCDLSISQSAFAYFPVQNGSKLNFTMSARGAPLAAPCNGEWTQVFLTYMAAAEAASELPRCTVSFLRICNVGIAKEKVVKIWQSTLFTPFSLRSNRPSNIFLCLPRNTFSELGRPVLTWQTHDVNNFPNNIEGKFMTMTKLTLTTSTKYFSLIGSQKIEANQRAGILCLPCR